jgi:hypothetical protein
VFWVTRRAEGVVRSATLISLATQVPYRVLPLVRSAPGRAADRRGYRRLCTPTGGIARLRYVLYRCLSQTAGNDSRPVGGDHRSWMCRPARVGTWQIRRPRI